MRQLLRHIVAATYKPFLVKYLSRTRLYTYRDLVLEVPPQVFHPRFFHSTHLLLRYLGRLRLASQTFLELGAGSGLLSIYASRRGAQATATDISKKAIAALQLNRTFNAEPLQVIESDLFEQLPQQRFDIIAINPPYYKKTPVTAADHAWYCGENGEYFRRLFAGLPAYMHDETIVLMVLSEVCDLALIETCAAANGFRLCCRQTRQHLLEKNFIYQIHKSDG